MKQIVLPNSELLEQISQMVAQGQRVTLRVKGISMRHFIEHARDKVVLARADHFCKGDVVLAEIRKGYFVLHRIESIRDGKVLLRGDGNWSQTERCTLANVRAKAVAFVRKGMEVRTDSALWRIYSFLWCSSPLFVRRCFLAVHRRLPGVERAPHLASKR